MSDRLAFIDAELASLTRGGLMRELRTVTGPQSAVFEIDGQEVLNFSSNDYLGLANHPEVVEAARAELDRSGLGAAASRLITGDMEAHERLEAAVARLKGTEAALVFNSGYHANTGTIPSLVGRGDMILSDRLNHASIIDGARLSHAATVVYGHNDLADLEARLESCQGHRRRLIVTDALFSMDGDLAPIAELVALAEHYDAVLMVDEAHATGVFGETGAGVAEHQGVSDRVDVQMGTFGKALGSFGAYVAGPDKLRTLLFNRARSFVFTTGLPPSVCAASLRALELLADEGLALKATLWARVERFRAGLDALGIDYLDSPSQIFPLVIGEAAETMRVSEALKARGIWAHGIRPPTVPEGTSRVRMTLTAGHTEVHVDAALNALEDVLGPGRKRSVVV